MNYSFWEKKILETTSNVTIIGAGIVGLSTAISIKEKYPHLSISIYERMPYSTGASTRNAGFTCIGSVSELLSDIEKMGADEALTIVKMRWHGLQILKKRVPLKSMEYNHCGGTELFFTNEESTIANCVDNIHWCNQWLADGIGVNHVFKETRNQILSNFSDASIFSHCEGSINPASMINYLSKLAHSLGIAIYRGINVVRDDVDNKIIYCEGNIAIPYQLLIYTTNAFAAEVLPQVKVMPARNQVLVTEPIPNNPLQSTYHLDKGYVYFRPYEDRIILGGGRNIDAKSEMTSQFETTQTIQNYLISILEQIVPGTSSKVTHWWSGILGVHDSKRPICERLSPQRYAGIRMGGMGVAIGSYIGKQLSELIEMDV